MFLTIATPTHLVGVIDPLASTQILMKRFFALLFLSMLSIGTLQAAEANWLTDYDQALKQAASENKPLVINFTGSDWCGWCIKLDKEVFSQSEFVDYANSNLVLLKLDFPRNKQLPDDEKTQNARLAKEYQVRGYPTILVLDSQAKKIGKLGYQKGGASNWIASLEKITEKP